jgi:hypothetical protein
MTELWTPTVRATLVLAAAITFTPGQRWSFGTRG